MAWPSFLLAFQTCAPRKRVGTFSILAFGTQPPAAEPVHPGAGEESDEEDGEALRNDDERHLKGTRPQKEQGDKRHGRAGHDGAELGHRLAGPKLQEIVMSPQGWGCHRGGMVVVATARRVRPGVSDPPASATIAGAH